jgi:hypothetical protein
MGADMNIRERIELHKSWLTRTNDAPLVNTFVSKRLTGGGGGGDLDASPAEIVDRKRRGAESQLRVPGDKIPVATIDFGTPLTPALGGAGVERDATHCWAVPCAKSVDELRVQPFDPDHPLWVRYIRLFEKILDDWSWETYLPGIASMLGPMDMLAGMLGPETLAMEMVTNPEGVRARAEDAAELFLQALDVQIGMIRQAGLADGTVDWMRIWLPGDGVCASEDFTALIGPAHFRDFVAAPFTKVLARLDTGMLHIHSAAHVCIPEIVKLPGLHAMELSNDPNGPDLDALIRLGGLVQDAGLSLQMSNWEHPLTIDEARHLLGSLDPRGLLVSFQTSSMEEARELYDLAKTYRA